MAEPQRCKYRLDVETPAVCTADHLEQAFAQLARVGVAIEDGEGGKAKSQ